MNGIEHVSLIEAKEAAEAPASQGGHERHALTCIRSSMTPCASCSNCRSRVSLSALLNRKDLRTTLCLLLARPGRRLRYLSPVISQGPRISAIS